MDKIIIYRRLPFPSEQEEGFYVLSFSELEDQVKSKKILRHLLRYQESILVAYDLQTMPKPFLTALLIRILSKKRSFWKDKKGRVQKISFSLMFSLLFRSIKDLLRKRILFDEIKFSVQSLLNSVKIEKRALLLSNPPIYLRTDLLFGLQAGGSVGHIAGVLNHLGLYSTDPIFLTSDCIPTVRTEIEWHVISPGNDFWEFREIPSLHFNSTFLMQAIQKIGSRKPSFIYQRYSLNNFSGVQLANYYKVPFVLEYNGSEIWVGRNWGKLLKYEKISEQIEFLNLKASDLVVVVSQPLKDELVKKGIGAEKILINPNGVDPDKYSPQIDGKFIRQKFRLEKKITLGFIGTFEKWHGAEILAEAYGRLLQKFPNLREEICLLLMGDGITMSNVKQIFSAWSVLDTCVLTGMIPQEEGPHYLAACDILISPHVPNSDGSPFFGSPTKLFEYMAMGKGIVASRLDQIGDILEHDRTAWLVESGNAEDLMNGLKKLIDDKSKRIQLGVEARKEVVAKYTWREHTKKIIEKLQELC